MDRQANDSISQTIEMSSIRNIWKVCDLMSIWSVSKGRMQTHWTVKIANNVDTLLSKQTVRPLWVDSGKRHHSNRIVICTTYADESHAREFGMYRIPFAIYCDKKQRIILRRCLCLDNDCSSCRHHWRSSISSCFFVICGVWNGTIIAYVE